MGELERAKAEIAVVYNLMNAVNAVKKESRREQEASANAMNSVTNHHDIFRKEVRYVRHNETEEDKQISRRTHMANMASSQLLFREASSTLSEKAVEIREMIRWYEEMTMMMIIIIIIIIIITSSLVNVNSLLI